MEEVEQRVELDRCQEVAEFGEHDQVECARWPLERHFEPLDADVRPVAQPLARPGHGELGDVGRQELVAMLSRLIPSDNTGPGADAAPDETLIRDVIYIADALGLSVVAEGVETLEQHEALVALGCHRAQGYRFSRPVPAAQVVDLIFGTAVSA